MFKDMELPAKNFLMFAADEFKGVKPLKFEDVAKVCGYNEIYVQWVTEYLREYGYISCALPYSAGVGTRIFPKTFTITDEGYKWINRQEKVF